MLLKGSNLHLENTAYVLTLPDSPGDLLEQIQPRQLGLQLCFGDLSICDVAGNLGGANDSALSVPQRGDRDGYVDSAAMFCNTYRLEMIYCFTTRNTSQNLGLLRGPLRWDEHAHRLAHCLLRRIAEQPFRARIPTRDDAIQILTDDRFFRRNNERGQPRVLFFFFFL